MLDAVVFITGIWVFDYRNDLAADTKLPSALFLISGIAFFGLSIYLNYIGTRKPTP
jgi:hypothetical protein